VRSVLRMGLVVGLGLLLSAGAAAAQAAPGAVPDTAGAPEKSALTATLISVFLPGGGHLYAEDKRRGAVLLSVFAVGVVLGAGGENAVTLPGMVLVGIPWWYGVIDAHNAVRRYNRARASRVSLVPWMAPGRVAGRTDGPRVGITVGGELRLR
jgi:hypothetical protein